MFDLILIFYFAGICYFILILQLFFNFNLFFAGIFILFLSKVKLFLFFGDMFFKMSMKN